MSLDPRDTLVRDGLAAAELEGVTAADRFVPTRAMQVSAFVAPIRRAPAPDAEQLDQLLFGETFEVLEEGGGFALGQATRDGYVGYVDLEALSSPVLAPTHRVTALRSYLFSEPDIKSPVLGLVSMNALVAVEAGEGRLAKVARGGWIAASHLAGVGSGFDTDWAGVAERFLGAPYLWGGRESLGLDCSGLVQQALYACGRACPRDTDQQRELGVEVALGDLRRGDLVFWRGHVGIMLDGARLLHANAHHMAVAVEPLQKAIARISTSGGGEPAAFRRP